MTGISFKITWGQGEREYALQKGETGHELDDGHMRVHYTIVSLLYQLEVFHNKSFFNDSENSEV